MGCDVDTFIHNKMQQMKSKRDHLPSAEMETTKESVNKMLIPQQLVSQRERAVSHTFGHSLPSAAQASLKALAGAQDDMNVKDMSQSGYRMSEEELKE